MAFGILLVDDSTTVRAVLAKALALAGVPVGDLHQAGDGRQALEILESRPIDLVFCDVSMPVMDGEELVAAMQARGLLAQTTVIMVTSADSGPRQARLRALGVRDFIRKPFTPERIREAAASAGLEVPHA